MATSSPLQVFVMGGGMIGRAIAYDLASHYKLSVRIGDKYPSACRTRFEQSFGASLLTAGSVSFVEVDCTSEADVAAKLAGSQFVVGAVPSEFGFAMLKNVILAGPKAVADISFTPEDYFQLAPLAKEKGVTVVVDAGVAPGIPNLIFGMSMLDYETPLPKGYYYVGGIPTVAGVNPPWDYMLSWSVNDTIEEFTRPGRIKKEGEIVTLPGASDLSLDDWSHVRPGLQLESFVTDGLRSLLQLPITNMYEKTLRYPGHTARMLELRENGSLSGEKLAETTAMLAKEWAPKEGQSEMIVMKIILEGKRKEDGKEHQTVYTLTEYEKGGLSAMARCTGFTCAATLAMLTSGKLFKEHGVFGLEHVAQTSPEAAKDVLAKLAGHDVKIQRLS